jgi:hypothetical protein
VAPSKKSAPSNDLTEIREFYMRSVDPSSDLIEIREFFIRSLDPSSDLTDIREFYTRSVDLCLHLPFSESISFQSAFPAESRSPHSQYECTLITPPNEQYLTPIPVSDTTMNPKYQTEHAEFLSSTYRTRLQFVVC